MRQTPADDVDRFGFTRHELLSSSTTTAAAPLALVSAPQATFEVTTLADVVDANDGVLSLREAITLANNTPGRDTVTFHESLFGGTIQLNPEGGYYGVTSYALRITEDVIIDGDSLNRGTGSIVIDGTAEFDPFDNTRLTGTFGSLEATGAAVHLEDLTITGTEFGIIARSSDLTLNRVAIDDTFSARDVGGANGIGIRLIDGTLVLTDSSVSNNDGTFLQRWHSIFEQPRRDRSQYHCWQRR